MVSGVLDPFIYDEAEVVAIGQDGVDMADAEWAGWPLFGGSGGAAFFLEHDGELLDRDVTLGVAPERPLHQGCSFWVYFNRSALDSVGPISDIEVADWSFAWGASGFRLLVHTLEYFVG